MAVGSVLNYNSATVADTVYHKGVLIARDVEFELPEITPATADIQATGKMAAPIPSQLEDMECKITKIGEDKGLKGLISANLQGVTLEFRWVEDEIDHLSAIHRKGCKAFISGYIKTFPGMKISPGEVTENEVTIAVTKYKLFVNGDPYYYIDRFNHKVLVGGKDVYETINPLL